MELVRITANFTGNVRHDNMEGREWLVVPMVMIVEGVLNGSNGPLLYPAEELSKTPEVWNQKPVVVYHPERNGEGVTACDPVVITNRKVGVIMNTRFEDGKLKAEAWLNPSRMDVVDDRISKAIENNETMELSTGLFTDNENMSGEFDGKAYEAIARNYRPDHLALLPDLVGACSREDGAGFLRLNSEDVKTKIPEVWARDFFPRLEAIGIDVSKLQVNQTSHESIRDMLWGLLRNSRGDDAWIENVFDEFFIFSEGGKLFKQSFETSDSKVEIVGTAEEVVRVIEFRTIDGAFVGNNLSGKVEEMKKIEKIVNALIANESTQWTEDDKESLLKLNEETLQKMSPVVNEQAEQERVDAAVKKAQEEAVANAARQGAADANASGGDGTTNSGDGNSAAQEPVTLEQHIANSPAELQGPMRSMLANHNAEKRRLVNIITANERNGFTEEQLLSKELEELRTLATLATPAPAVNAVDPVMNYGGQAPVADNTENAEEPMEMPSTAVEQG